MKNSMISWTGVLCLLESVIMSALFELQKAAGILLLVGIGLTITAILLDGAEADRKREEKRQQKYRRRYQNDDMNDAVRRKTMKDRKDRKDRKDKEKFSFTVIDLMLNFVIPLVVSVATSVAVTLLWLRLSGS